MPVAGYPKKTWNQQLTERQITESEVQRRLTFLMLQLEQFSVASVVDSVIRSLHEGAPRTFTDLQSMPWVSLLLVELAMRNPASRLYGGGDLSSQQLHQFRQRLWDLIGATGLKGPNLSASLRSYVPVQLEFQVTRRVAHLRWPMLIARLESTHPGRQLFEQEFGLSPIQLLDALWLLHIPIINRTPTIPKLWAEGFQQEYRDAILRILDLVSSDFLELREALVRGNSERVPAMWELTQLPFALRKPLLKLHNGAWIAWHPTLFERGLEELVHNVLMRRGDTYLRTYTRLFEDYVVELSKEIWPDLVDESTWKKSMGHQASSVEAIISGATTNIFVEAKMAFFHDAVLLDEDPYRLASRLERVTDALYQARKVSQRLRAEAYKFPRRAAATEEFLLVVTSRELYVGGGLRLQELLPQGSLDFDDVAVEQRMPLENVFVVSIDDFELLQASMATGKLDLPSFLRQAAEKNRNPITASLFLEQHLRSATSDSPLPLPRVVREATEASLARIEKNFPGRSKAKDKR